LTRLLLPKVLTLREECASRNWLNRNEVNEMNENDE